jgi:hypothetical protein
MHYLNSGDWVETLSAIVETEDHEWKVINYQEWLKAMYPDEEEEQLDCVEIELSQLLNEANETL